MKTPSQVLRAVSLGLFILSPTAARAQSADGAALRQRIVAYIAEHTDGQLPPGDTAVTWTSSPILFHTIAQRPTSLRVGMLRGDRLFGVAELKHAGATPQRFGSVWRRGDSTVVDLRGEVDASELRVSGTDTAAFAIPTMPWSIADYGMDDLLLPLFSALDSSDRAVQIAVFRPYTMRWDTLQVRVSDRAGARVVETLGDERQRTIWAIQDGRLLSITQPGMKSERHPLEGSALYARYRALEHSLSNDRQTSRPAP